MEIFFDQAADIISSIYQLEHYDQAMNSLRKIYADWQPFSLPGKKRLDQSDTIMIAYGDSLISPGEYPLRTLRKFMERECFPHITNIHLLPVYPSTSDDGFSVSDYLKVDQNLGEWDNIGRLNQSFGLMLDAVVNHTSVSHPWFQKCLRGEFPYTEYYIEKQEQEDYSNVVRPRALPLFTKFPSSNGDKWYWTTFSEDQADLNFKNPLVLAEILNVILFYASKGARFIRLDAVGFIWKEAGTTCMHLDQVHAIIRLFRLFLDKLFPGVILITETNVPHKENISYFGCGDEAGMVYQFPLPVLTLYTLLDNNCTKLKHWVNSLEETQLPEDCTYFNFLASHDGIGMRPADGLLDDDEKRLLVDTVIRNGGQISYKNNQDGSTSAYELNISYIDALSNPGDNCTETRFEKFMAAQSIMLSLNGVPGIYYHSLFGSRSWTAGLLSSGINRRINREKLDAKKLAQEIHLEGKLRNKIFSSYLNMLEIRTENPEFSPYAKQKIIDLGSSVFALRRYTQQGGSQILVLINVTGKNQEIHLRLVDQGNDLLADDNTPLNILRPYQTRWIKVGDERDE